MGNLEETRAELRLYRLKEVFANPFRRLDRYPLQSEKIETLRESYRSTSVWPNVVARLRAEGGVEIAFGHHRIQAARLEYGEEREVTLAIMDLTNEDMLRMMADENMEEYNSSFSSIVESVRIVVEAYANDQISLPPVNSMTRFVRHAPKFAVSPTPEGEHPYTSTSVIEFMRIKRHRVEFALNALVLIEEGWLTDRHYDGLSLSKASALNTYKDMAEKKLTELVEDLTAQAVSMRVTGDDDKAERLEQEISDVRKQAPATIKKVLDSVSEDLRHGGQGKAVADQMLPAKKRALRNPNKLADSIIKRLDKIFREGDSLTDQIEYLLHDVRPLLDQVHQRGLIIALQGVIERAQDFEERLHRSTVQEEETKEPEVRPPPPPDAHPDE